MYSAMIFSVEPERSRLRRSVRSAMAWGLRARIKEGWRRTMGFWCWWEIDREAGYIAAYPAGLGREASCWLASPNPYVRIRVQNPVPGNQNVSAYITAAPLYARVRGCIFRIGLYFFLSLGLPRLCEFRG
jgi:hypothetical protein